MKLVNGKGLVYKIIRYDKKAQILVVKDPHTGKPVEVLDAKQTLKTAGFRVLK